MHTRTAISLTFSIFIFAVTSLTCEAQVPLIWSVGLNDNTHPFTAANPGNGGGTNTTFVQENGTINPLPGIPNSPEIDQMADNDYYFAGTFSTVIPGIVAFYGDYTPIGLVSTNEETVERAFAGDDNDLRYHFNLPDTLQPTDLLSVTFAALSLNTDGQPDPRYGVEIYFNGVLVQPQIVIRPPQFVVDYETPQFTLASVGAQVGPGFDNVISVKGISYSGGGSWMGFDYVQLNAPTNPIPSAVFPWGVGKDDGGHPPGSGGGTNANFVQENGSINPLPGSPFNVPTTPASPSADNDYYFAGTYTTVIASNVIRYGPYVPVGLVSTNEEAAERAFAGDDNDLRYHFNLPNSSAPSDLVSVSFEPLDLDNTAGLADPRYGVEIYFNGILVQPQVIIRPAQLGQKISTLPFSLGSVQAAVGAGFDNIISIRGISYSSQGGGSWMGFDYVQLNPASNAVPLAVLPWGVGQNDNASPVGDGGGTNATFVEESGTSNPLPGSPTNEELPLQADDDYYFAGAYTTVIPGNGIYEPVGLVLANEEAVARGFGGEDNDLRYHFNLPSSLKPDDVLSFSFDALNLDESGEDPFYGIEVYFNNVLIQTQIVIHAAQLGQTFTSPRFTAASVNAQAGVGFDNIIRLKGFNYSATGGANLLGLDYLQLNTYPESPFPWVVGRDDNTHLLVGDGGGANTTFWQEAGGINALPGRSDNPEVDQQSDNDYYFAGDYTNTISSVVTRYGAYTPIGSVLANEEGAERAFAGTDLDLRYHFNLPSSLSPNDTLSVTFDANNLDNPGAVNTDPRFGVEVYFNGVLVQTQVVIRAAQLDVDYTTPEFTLASVNAQVGPGFDNIVSLKGISYNGVEGGGNWMGIDYVRLNGPKPPQFLPTVISNNEVRLNWTGGGALEWAPTVLGPWTPVTPAPVLTYSEAIVSGTNRFYRLTK